MVAAPPGVNQAWLFTACSRSAPAGRAGRCPAAAARAANLGLDLVTIGDAFVVVVVGGMGSIPGAFLAALLISEIKAHVRGHRPGPPSFGDVLLVFQADPGG